MQVSIRGNQATSQVFCNRFKLLEIESHNRILETTTNPRFMFTFH